jgi:hypothetical protein
MRRSIYMSYPRLGDPGDIPGFRDAARNIPVSVAYRQANR